MNGLALENIRNFLNKEIEKYVALSTCAPATSLEQHHYLIGRLNALTGVRDRLEAFLKSASGGGEYEA
jgi:hypothetical protein